MSRCFLHALADQGHRVPLGTECDTLHVSGASDTILRQIQVMPGTASTS